MISHELKIGQRIFDTCDNRWGVVLLIGGEEKDMDISVEESDTIVTYRPDNSDGECETTADMAYPLVEDKYFWGEDVCLEIHRDDFDDDHDYDYFCPERDENCWDFECA